MDKKIWFSVLVAIAVLFIGVYLFLDNKNNQEFSNDRQDAIEDAIQRPTVTINTKHQYKDGTHAFIGTIEVPTPCHSHNAEVVKRDDVTEIALSYKTDSEICAQVIEERNFRVDFEGSAEENIVATLNGLLVNLNVFEVPDNQSIGDFEILIKG